MEKIGQVWLIIVVDGAGDDSPLPIPSDDPSATTHDEDREYVGTELGAELSCSITRYLPQGVHTLLRLGHEAISSRLTECVVGG